jgi:hypothetical protein
MKINQSRKSTQSIMAHQSFEGVLLKKDGIEMYIPKEWITQKGKIKKYALKAFYKLQKEQLRKAV